MLKNKQWGSISKGRFLKLASRPRPRESTFMEEGVISLARSFLESRLPFAGASKLVYTGHAPGEATPTFFIIPLRP